VKPRVLFTSPMIVWFVFIASAGAAWAQSGELPRHGVIGLQIAPPDLTKPEDPTNPPTIKAVTPGGAGEAADIRVGDVLLALNGVPVTTSAGFAQEVSRHITGETLTVRLARGGEQITRTVTLKPRPYETSPDAVILYTSVTAGGARRRVIVTRPKEPGRHPAVLLIGGLGCYSLDGEISRSTGYGPILAALAKKEYVTMRVEKSGEGDSEGPLCTDPKSTVDRETDGYVAGLRLLKTYDFVDPARVFIFAHSLGPLLGSIVVTEEPVRGLIAAETIGRSWFEYGLENVRRQSALAGELPDEVDADVRTHAECAYHFYLRHEMPGQVEAIGPQCVEMIRSYAGMPYTYMQEIGDLSLGKQWKQVDIPVLVIYGTSDPATSADENRYLVELINRFHPDRASYVELEGMGHDFARYASQAEFLNRSSAPTRPHPYDDEILTTILHWLDRHAQG
jgi:uncharacterized protein